MTILTHDLASESNEQRVALEASAPAIGNISTLSAKLKGRTKRNQFLKKNETEFPHRVRTVTSHVKREPHKNHVLFGHHGDGRALDFLFAEIFSFNTRISHNSKHLYFRSNEFDATGNMLLRAKAVVNVPKTFDAQGKPTSWKQQPLELDRIPWLMNAFASIATKCIDVPNDLHNRQSLNYEIHNAFMTHLGEHTGSFFENVTQKLEKALWDVTHHTSEDEKLEHMHGRDGLPKGSSPVEVAPMGASKLNVLGAGKPNESGVEGADDPDAFMDEDGTGRREASLPPAGGTDVGMEPTPQPAAAPETDMPERGMNRNHYRSVASTVATTADALKKYHMNEAANVLDVAVFKSTTLLLKLRKVYELIQSLSDGSETPFHKFINSADSHQHHALLAAINEAFKASQGDVKNSHEDIESARFSIFHSVLEEGLYKLLVESVVDINNHAIDLLAMFCRSIHKPELFESMALEYRKAIFSIVNGVERVNAVNIHALENMWKVFSHVANLCKNDHKHGEEVKSYKNSVVDNIKALCSGNMGTIQTKFVQVLLDKGLRSDKKLQQKAKTAIRDALSPLAFDGLDEHVKKSFPKRDYGVVVHKHEARAHGDVVAAILKRVSFHGYFMMLKENSEINIALRYGTDLIDLVNDIMCRPGQITNLMSLKKTLGVCKAFGTLGIPFEHAVVEATKSEPPSDAAQAIAKKYDYAQLSAFIDTYHGFLKKKHEGPLTDTDRQNLSDEMERLHDLKTNWEPHINVSDMLALTKTGNYVDGYAKRDVLRYLSDDATHKYVARRFSNFTEETTQRNHFAVNGDANIRAFQWFIDSIHPQIYCAFIPDDVQGVVSSGHRYNGFNMLGSKPEGTALDLRNIGYYFLTGKINNSLSFHTTIRFMYNLWSRKFGNVLKQNNIRKFAGASTKSSTIDYVPNQTTLPQWESNPGSCIEDDKDDSRQMAHKYHALRKRELGGAKKAGGGKKHEGKKHERPASAPHHGGKKHEGKKHQRPASASHHGGAAHHDPISSRTRSRTRK